MRYSQGSVHHLLFLATTTAVFSVKKQGHANSLADATPATEDLTRLQHHHFDPPGHHGSHITPPRKSGASYDERMMKADAGILSPSETSTTSYDERGARMKADASILLSVMASDDPSEQRAAAEEGQEEVATIGSHKTSRKTVVQEEDVSIFMPSSSAGQQSSVCTSGYIDCDNGKVRGTDQSCKDACNGDCCVGGEWFSGSPYYHACEFFTGKVCKDGSCNGSEACGYQSTPLIVVNSCKGHRSCHSTNFPVAMNSCKGVRACQSVNSTENITNSCNGEFACIFLGYNGGEVGYVSDSCNGKMSCWVLGGNYGKVGNIKNSCNSDEACDGGGEGGFISGGIENSCNAYKACYGAGQVRYVCTTYEDDNWECASGYIKGAGISTKLSSCCNGEKECYEKTEITLPAQCKVCTRRMDAPAATTT
jgi:hypothetical protein